MKTKTIKQAVDFESGPHDVYEMLMDSAKHAAFTGDAAEISREVGGSISAYGGYIEGKNLELVPDEKIVQSWRAVDWPEGHFSTATFELTKKGTGTRLDFTQSRVPDDQFDDISQGWYDNYWGPMKEALKG